MISLIGSLYLRGSTGTTVWADLSSGNTAVWLGLYLREAAGTTVWAERVAGTLSQRQQVQLCGQSVWLGLYLRQAAGTTVWAERVAGTLSQTGSRYNCVSRACGWDFISDRQQVQLCGQSVWLGLYLRQAAGTTVWAERVAGTLSQTGSRYTCVGRACGWDFISDRQQVHLCGQSVWLGLYLRQAAGTTVWAERVAGTLSQTGSRYTCVGRACGWDFISDRQQVHLCGQICLQETRACGWDFISDRQQVHLCGQSVWLGLYLRQAAGTTV